MPKVFAVVTLHPDAARNFQQCCSSPRLAGGLFLPQHMSEVFSRPEMLFSVSSFCSRCAVPVLAFKTGTSKDLHSLRRGFCNEPHEALLIKRALLGGIAC